MINRLFFNNSGACSFRINEVSSMSRPTDSEEITQLTELVIKINKKVFKLDWVLGRW